MDWDPVLLNDRRAAMVANGLWQGQTIIDHLKRQLAVDPDRVAAVSYRADKDRPERVTLQQLWDRSSTVATQLSSLGVKPGDVVAYQLPNWIEFIELSLACALCGAVANPLMHIFRQRELSFMLGFNEAKVFVTPATYRGFDFETMAADVVQSLPRPPMHIVVDGDGPNSYANLLLAPPVTPGGTPLTPINADDVMLLMYTSGTTGEPKGVMHTANTLFANINGFIERLELTGGDVVLGASPMAHLTGFGYLAMMPLALGATTVLQDVWDGARALEIIAAEGVTFSMASSPFVADLCDAAEAGGTVSAAFRTFCCAGAPIPPALIERAQDVLQLRVCSAWGMTENGAVTITEPSRAADKSGCSDGKPVPGMEVKIVDADSNAGSNSDRNVERVALPVGVTGSLLVRGASLFGGYLKRPDLNNVDAKGWFDTGDLAFLDAEGYVRIDGRSKDLIIRGGENIPVVEIENLLYRHAAVSAVAIVGYPDDRLGERACAFVTVKPGSAFTLDEMRAYLTAEQVAKQYHPERLELIDEMPRTASGKIQKFVLRAKAASSNN
jgi:cyclohexanecarboxylate-CoA ligase